MEEFHEMVHVVDHRVDGKPKVCSGFIVVIPEYKGQALIIVREMFLTGDDVVRTEQGLQLTRRTLRGEHFLWPFDGIIPQTDKGKEILKKAKADYRPASRPLNAIERLRKRRKNNTPSAATPSELSGTGSSAPSGTESSTSSDSGSAAPSSTQPRLRFGPWSAIPSDTGSVASSRASSDTGSAAESTTLSDTGSVASSRASSDMGSAAESTTLSDTGSVASSRASSDTGSAAESTTLSDTGPVTSSRTLSIGQSAPAESAAGSDTRLATGSAKIIAKEVIGYRYIHSSDVLVETIAGDTKWVKVVDLLGSLSRLALEKFSARFEKLVSIKEMPKRLDPLFTMEGVLIVKYKFRPYGGNAKSLSKTATPRLKELLHNFQSSFNSWKWLQEHEEGMS